MVGQAGLSGCSCVEPVCSRVRFPILTVRYQAQVRATVGEGMGGWVGGCRGVCDVVSFLRTYMYECIPTGGNERVAFFWSFFYSVCQYRALY